MIEANDFYRYIEEEQKEELIDYILAYCPAKVIKIDKTESLEVSGKVCGNIQGADLKAGAKSDTVKGNYCSIEAPLFRRLKKALPRDKYYWIDKSVMKSIESLKKGSTFSQSYEIDFTFGLNVSEAKTLGLDMEMHKKITYTIYVKC